MSSVCTQDQAVYYGDDNFSSYHSSMESCFCRCGCTVKQCTATLLILQEDNPTNSKSFLGLSDLNLTCFLITLQTEEMAAWKLFAILMNMNSLNFADCWD